MTPSYICGACRRRALTRIRFDTGRQWRPASTFVSLSGLVGKPQKTDHASGVDRPLTKDTKPHRRRNQNSNVPGDFLESLFAESLHPEPSEPESAPPSGTVAKTYEDIEILREMIVSLKKPDAPIRSAWDFLVSNFGAKATPFRSLPASFASVAGRLLQRLVEVRKRGVLRDEVPSVTEICQTYNQFGLLKHDTWNALVLDLLDKLGSTSAYNAGSSVSKSPDDAINITTDLLGAWRQTGRTIRHDGGSQPGLQRKDWDFLLPPMSTKLATSRALRQAREKMRNLLETNSEYGSLEFLERFPRSENRIKSAIALVTFAVLLDCSAITTEAVYKKTRFVSRMKELLSIYSINVETLSNGPSSRLQPVNATTLENLKIDWLKVSKFVGQVSDANRVTSERLSHQNPLFEQPLPQKRAIQESPTTFLGAQRPSKTGLVNIHRELANALNRRDITTIDRLWQNAQINPTAELCNQFILSYASLRYPNSAIDIWNHMVKASISPTLSTWNSMLEGCKASRSPEALEGVWAKMIASGAKPDNICWTTRISGLSDCHKTREVLKALNEMESAWIQEARRQKIKDFGSLKDLNGVIKPTTSVINACVHGLVHNNRLEDANQVLARAANLGIKPDLITFNIVLTPLVRQGNTIAVQAILLQMQALGIEADSKTFTTVLDEIIHNNTTQTPAEQINAINYVLDQMIEAGISATLHTYGKIIYNLLNSSGTGDMTDLTVVNSVLARITNQGLEPGAHIYTMLINHYFLCSPPDFEAVRVLVEHIRLGNKIVDNVFWDRVIEGYARTGYTAAALAVYGTADREGSRVGWYTTKELLEALMRNGEEGIARDLVRNVKVERGGPIGLGTKGVDGQHAFWELAAEYGLET